jgi:putative NADH-flavin reductase
MSNVVLFGASGAIGTAIGTELVSRGHTVTGVSRSGTSTVTGVTPAVGNVTDTEGVARLVDGADAVISAIGPRHDGSDPLDTLMHATHAIVDGLRKAHVKRLIVIGGAGSLKQNGVRHVDNPHFPQAYKALALAHAETRDFYLTVTDLDWTYVSPAEDITPGERTGTYRVGGDEVLTDANGVSRITIPDYAIGIVDQLEHPTVHRRQITLAY